MRQLTIRGIKDYFVVSIQVEIIPYETIIMLLYIYASFIVSVSRVAEIND